MAAFDWNTKPMASLRCLASRDILLCDGGLYFNQVQAVTLCSSSGEGLTFDLSKIAVMWCLFVCQLWVPFLL